jgi:hypothetical protein
MKPGWERQGGEGETRLLLDVEFKLSINFVVEFRNRNRITLRH